MTNSVHSEALSKVACDELGDGDATRVEVYAAPGGGYVYSYSNAASGHGLYADCDGSKPYATVEAAVAAANDPGSEAGDFRGPGANSGEWYGDLEAAGVL